MSPTETTCQGERDLETALGVVERIHALRLQIIHEMGSVREVEQAAVRNLMAEFARLQSILCEDLTKSLSALRSELEASSEVLSADILNTLNLHPGDPGFSRVRELIQKHHQSVSMKVNLPLIELEVAKEDLDRSSRNASVNWAPIQRVGRYWRRSPRYCRAMAARYERPSSSREPSDQGYSTEFCWHYPWTSLWKLFSCLGSWTGCLGGSA